MRLTRSKIEIIEPFPAEQRQAVRDLVLENEWLLPNWLERLVITFEQPKDGDVSLRAEISEEYRLAKLRVCPEWLLSSMDAREADIRHEFIHVATEPLYSVAAKLVDMIDDPKLAQWAREELRLGVERTTVDLEYALDRKLKGV